VSKITFVAASNRGLSPCRWLEFIHSGSNNTKHDDHINALKEGLAWAGYNAGVGGNVTILPTLWADNHPAKLATDAHTLINTNHVDVLVAAGGTASSQAAQNETAATLRPPVVFTSVAEPRLLPANMTGICARTSELDAERLSLLRELLPGKTNFGALFNHLRFNKDPQKANLNNTALILGLSPLNPQEVDPGGSIANSNTLIAQAFQNWANAPCQGALVTADTLFNNHRATVISAAAGTINIAGVIINISPIPAIYQWREFAEDGGLMSYGPNLRVAYQVAGTYVGRILDKIAAAAGGAIDITDMPVLPLNNCELVINLKTAKALDTAMAGMGGFKIPPTLLARADHTIAV
jgi:putative tryptophan/tyrosine transport system substrate-binding protein